MKRNAELKYCLAVPQKEWPFLFILCGQDMREERDSGKRRVSWPVKYLDCKQCKSSFQKVKSKAKYKAQMMNISALGECER